MAAQETRELKFHLNADGLGSGGRTGEVFVVKSQETLGLTKREWFPWNMSIDLPPDQTPDDARSVCFESAPLTEDLEVLGNPRLQVRLSSTDRWRSWLLASTKSHRMGNPGL